jgi:hypothetical protein
MAMNHYNVRRGFIAEASAGTVPEWSAHAPGYLHEDYNPPCLVVTGNLAAARARLEATTPDDVKQAAVDALSTFASIKLRPISWAEAVNALADAGLLRGPETSSAAPEGAALSASGTVRRAGGPDHGTAPVGDDCTSVIASALRDIYEHDAALLLGRRGLRGSRGRRATVDHGQDPGDARGVGGRDQQADAGGLRGRRV